VHGHPARGQLFARTTAQLVVAEGGEELHRTVEVRELNGRHCAPSGRFFPRFQGVHDVARLGHVLDADELDPLHVTDDCEVHTSHLGA